MLNRFTNMSDKMRLLIAGIMTLVILGTINFEIAGKEQIVRDGTTMLLRLAPRDPRSLLQGDYMALQYAMVNTVAREADLRGVSDGVAVVQLGDLHEASFIAIYDGQPLDPAQHLLRFRKRGGSVRLGSDAWFFEEGSADVYNSAVFGEVRVSKNGVAVLTGLMDASGQPLGVQLH